MVEFSREKRSQNAQPQNEILRSKRFGGAARNKQTAGNVYEYKPKIQQNDPQLKRFVEMCFDPTSPMNARLKETLLQMLGEAKQ